MGRKSKQKRCGLCSIKNKSKNWDEKNFFSLNCKDKLIPMVVSKEHKSEITEEEMDELKKLVEEYHSHLKINPSLKHVNGHFCIYLRS